VKQAIKQASIGWNGVPAPTNNEQQYNAIRENGAIIGTSHGISQAAKRGITRNAGIEL
jgi:hypothetical protein